jgi:hypothetical protein
MKDEWKKTVEVLLDKAKGSTTGGEALHYSQAVLNLINAAHGMGITK